MINVIGLGYIGLPTSLMLSVGGYDVTGTDINKNLIASLENNQVPFVEDGLENLLATARNRGIQFVDKIVEAEIYIIAVPTPYNTQSKRIDTSHVVTAVENVLEVCQEEVIIVIESTVSPGCIDKHIRPIVRKKVRLAHAPERIIPGSMLAELRDNARTIGVDDNTTGQTLRDVYGAFSKGEIVLTDIKTAEMTKVVENTFRDINIAFANELLKICDYDGMDAYEVIRIANKHPRVNILQPGPGVGGHCIAVDPWFLVGDYPGLANIILTARNINDSMPEYVLERIREIMKMNKLEDVRRVAIYGLTYKENVGDIRNSPSLQLLEHMRKHLAPALKCYDPFVNEQIVENQCFSLEDLLSDADIVVIMVAHDEIKKKYDLLSNKVILDTQNALGKGKNVYKL